MSSFGFCWKINSPCFCYILPKLLYIYILALILSLSTYIYVHAFASVYLSIGVIYVCKSIKHLNLQEHREWLCVRFIRVTPRNTHKCFITHFLSFVSRKLNSVALHLCAFWFIYCYNLLHQSTCAWWKYFFLLKEENKQRFDNDTVSSIW